MPTEGWADCILELRFAAATEALKNRPESQAADHSNWIPVPGEGPIEAFLRPDGRCAKILADQLSTKDAAVQVRKILPFASGLQGKVVLHASAVEREDRTHCFIGESGAGKSTLAHHLGKLGWTIVSDDLLPCRQIDTKIGTPIPVDGKKQPAVPLLHSINFIRRQARLETISAETLSRQQCMRKLLENGFGEMRDKAIWALQFKMYSEIAGTLYSRKLVVPDDMGKLLETAQQVSQLLEHS